MFAEAKVSGVAEGADEFPGDEVVRGETGLRSASDGKAVDVEDDDENDKQENRSDKSADDN